MRQRHYLKILFFALGGLSLLLFLSWLPYGSRVPQVSAHSFVIGSNPIDGSTITTPPSMVRIYFDTPISSLSQASVAAFTPNGPADGLLVSSGPGTVNATNARELDIPLLAASKLPQGGYEVRWMATSTTDGYTSSGLIGFNIGQSSVGLPGTPLLGPITSNYFPQLDLQGILMTLWDWLTLLALLFWAGTLIIDYVILPRPMLAALPEQARKRSSTLQFFCLLVLVFGEVVNLVLRSASFRQMQGGSGINFNSLIQFAISTNYGYFWCIRVILIILALLLLWWSIRRQQASDSGSGATPAPNRSSKRFSQLRQQASAPTTQDAPIVSAASALVSTRSQPRVTGAVAANISSLRGSTNVLPKIASAKVRVESPTPEIPTWQVAGSLSIAGLVFLSLALSNDITQLAPLPISAGVFTWLSLVAQATWFGALAYLGFTLFPLLPMTDPDRHTESLVLILKRIMPFLFSSIGVFLICELVLGEETIQVPEQFLSDPYGRTFLVRGLLLILMLIFTGYMFFWLLPRLQRQAVLLPVVDAELPARRARQFALDKTEQTIKRALQTLSGLAAAVLLCMALMDFFAPPVVYPALDSSAQSTNTASNTGSQTQVVGGVEATLQVLPARAGAANTLVILLNDAQGKPITNAQIKLRLNMDVMDMGTTTATLTANHAVYAMAFSANQAFTMGGSWTLQITIVRPNLSAVNMTFQIAVA